MWASSGVWVFFLDRRYIPFLGSARNGLKMKHLHRTFLIFGLVVSLLVVGGMFANKSVAHSLHHGHHKATTHASLICSWICAAGEIAQVSDFVFETLSSLVTKVELFPVHLVRTSPALFTFQRGPPHSSL